MRDSPASVRCAVNSAARSGKKYASTVVAADDAQVCPDGYDGWFGNPIGSVIAGSACDGRMYQYVYFASEHAMTCESNCAACMSANTCAAARSLRRPASTYVDASWFQCPAGVNVPPGYAHLRAIASWSAVRVSEM